MVNASPPGKRRQISNEEFEDALNNQDNAALIRFITNRYAGVLTEEDRRTIGLDALWRALQYHKPGKNQKFTSSLYRFTVWECNRALKKKNGGPSFVQMPEDEDGRIMEMPDKQVDLDTILHVRERIKRLPRKWQRKVLEQRFLCGMTAAEIGQRNGYSRETARQRIKSAVISLLKINRRIEECLITV